MEKIKLEDLVEKVDKIPVFPQVISKVIALAENPNANAADFENEIMKDQGLTTQVLKLANSAYYCGSRKVMTVSQATVRLGFKTIKNMVLASFVSKVLSNEMQGYGLEKEALWRQSQLCAITARLIAKRIKYNNPEEAYTAGLLKDIGKVVLDTYLQDAYKIILQVVEDRQCSFIQAEEEVLGYHHGQVGGQVARKWQLPDELTQAIEFHHEPGRATLNKQLVGIVHVADGMMMMMGNYLGVDGLAYVLSLPVLELLGLQDTMIQEIMGEVADIMNDESLFA